MYPCTVVFSAKVAKVHFTQRGKQHRCQIACWKIPCTISTKWRQRSKEMFCFRVLTFSQCRMDPYVTSLLYTNTRIHCSVVISMSKLNGPKYEHVQNPSLNGSRFSVGSQEFIDWKGMPTPKRGCNNPIILSIFPKNCMDLKKKLGED